MAGVVLEVVNIIADPHVLVDVLVLAKDIAKVHAVEVVQNNVLVAVVPHVAITVRIGVLDIVLAVATDVRMIVAVLAIILVVDHHIN